ncbi:MAG: TIGR00730 family Rossman fold protein [Chlamydiia bacterium]
MSALPPHSMPNKEALRSQDAWRALRILSEFVTGFDRMIALGPSVSFFGSARLSTVSPYYDMAYQTARLVAQKGFAVITGGGPGLMEAANKGAREVGGTSCGCLIDFPGETANAYIDAGRELLVRYFFVRKVMFVRYAQAFVIFPGGLGTLDEFFEVLTLIQTKKSRRFPVFLMGASYWQGLLDWLKESVLAHGCIGADDLSLFQVTDNPEVVATEIAHHFNQHQRLENF